MNEKVIDIFRIWGLAGLLLGLLPRRAPAPRRQARDTSRRHPALIWRAVMRRRCATTRPPLSWFEDALKTDPESPELISRTFLMEASEGRFDRARLLAESELKLDPTDAVAELILLIERIKAGDKAGALARADALPGGRRASLSRPAGAGLDSDGGGRRRRRRRRAAATRQIQRLRPAQISTSSVFSMILPGSPTRRKTTSRRRSRRAGSSTGG